VLGGRHIVEFEQQGKEKAGYRTALLTNLARDLKTKYGKGFSKSNIYLYRLFYIKYQKFQTVSGKYNAPYNQGLVWCAVQAIGSL
jgi:hypothetical protein